MDKPSKGDNIKKVTQGVPMWASHPRVRTLNVAIQMSENNQGDLWWTFADKTSKGRNLNNEGDLWWTLTGKTVKGRKLIRTPFGRYLQATIQSGKINKCNPWWTLVDRPSKD